MLNAVKIFYLLFSAKSNLLSCKQYVYNFLSLTDQLSVDAENVFSVFSYFNSLCPENMLFYICASCYASSPSLFSISVEVSDGVIRCRFL